MRSRDIDLKQDKIAPENGLECVKGLDSGQSVEVIPNHITWEISEARSLKVIASPSKEGVGGEMTMEMIYVEPYKHRKLIQTDPQKPKSLMDKDLTWVEGAFLTDVFIAEEYTRLMERFMEKFRLSRTDTNPKDAI